MSLKVVNLVKAYGVQKVLDGVSFEVGNGECFGIMGSSGCGKTTLLKAIAGLEPVDCGQISLGGKVLQDGKDSLPPRERRISFVFQDLALWPHMKAIDNVAFMFKDGPGRNERRAMAAELMKSVSLLPHHFDRYPDELSGGECQRVAIARALAAWPEVLLMDEPFSGLDVGLKEELSVLVAGLSRERNITILYVSHVEKEVRRLAGRVGLMRNGKIEVS